MARLPFIRLDGLQELLSLRPTNFISTFSSFAAFLNEGYHQKVSDLDCHVVGVVGTNNKKTYHNGTSTLVIFACNVAMQL